MPLSGAVRKAFVRLTACAIALLVVGCGPTGTASSGAPASPTAVAASPEGTSAPSPTAGATEPAITGLTGRVLFTRAGGSYGDETVFAADIDGSDEIQIGEMGKSCCIWAVPDGSLMVRAGSTPDDRMTPVFSAIDGTNERAFPLPDGLQFGSGPLSPDGKRIVLEGFTAPDFDGAGTYIGDVDGSNVEVLTEEAFIPGDFSPDGKTVVLFRGGPNTDEDAPPPGSLWLVEADGKDLRQLTPADRLVQCCGNFRWSPDGSRILFAGPDGSLWTIAPDGTGLAEVFHVADRWAITPTWSPDGSMILFALDPTDDPFAHPQNGLYVIRADGSDLTLLIGGPNFKREPIWLPAV